MMYVPVSHGGVVLAALPLSTAIFGVLITKNRPSRSFWVVSVLGFSVVATYSIFKGSAYEFYLGDIALLCAVILAGLGYAQGGALSTEISGWQVMCWVLVISLPLLSALTFFIYDSSIFTLSLEG